MSDETKPWLISEPVNIWHDGGWKPGVMTRNIESGGYWVTLADGEVVDEPCWGDFTYYPYDNVDDIDEDYNHG